MNAIVDFGILDIGDPACDLIPAWRLLTHDTRETFQVELLSNENYMLKLLFQKLYDFFIVPIIKAFNWLRGHRGSSAFRAVSSSSSVISSTRTKTQIIREEQAEWERKSAELKKQNAELKKKSVEWDEKQAKKKVRLEEQEKEILQAQQTQLEARKERERQRAEWERKQAEWKQEQADKKVREATEKNNREVLYSAISEGNLSLIESLLNKIKETKPEEFQRNPSLLLYRAIKSDHVEVVKLLMQYGMSLNFACAEYEHDWSEKHNAMYLAVKNQCIEIVKLLLEHEVPITQEAIHSAHFRLLLSEDHEKAIAIFKLLLDTNTLTFKPDSENSNEFFCFTTAIGVGHIETVKRSLDGLNTSQTKIYRYLGSRDASIIEYAISNRQPEVAKLLLIHYQTHKNSILCPIA